MCIRRPSVQRGIGLHSGPEGPPPRSSSGVLVIVWRGDVVRVYVDPTIGPRHILAFVPETHLSAGCHRAVPGGVECDCVEVAEPLWCDACTTDKKRLASHRRAPDGTWQEVNSVVPQQTTRGRVRS